MRVPRLIAAAALALAVAGCAAPIAQAPALHEIDRENAATRVALAIAPTALRGPLAYRPFAPCTFRTRYLSVDRQASDTTLTMAAHPLRDRLRITMSDGTNNSMAMIGTDGQLHDFNMVDLDGRRWTSDGYVEQARRALAEAQVRQNAAKPGVQLRMVNQLQIILPRYRLASWSPNDAVALVPDALGAPYARFLYRGTTRWQGQEAAVLDMMQIPSGGGAEYLIGYTLVDPRTLAPMLIAYSTGSSIRIERLSCSA
jgi:hypothetical protein